MLRILIVFVLALPQLALAGNENFPMGGRAAGMGNVGVNLSDVWSVHHNQAGLGMLTSPSVGIYYENRFLLNELAHKGVAAALPAGKGAFGLTVSQFGFSLYKEAKYALGYGMRLGENITAGVQIDYLSTTIGDVYGNRQAIAAEAGFQVKLTDALQVGAHVYNLNRAKMADFNNERIPTIMRFGAQYTFSDKVFVGVEVEKDIDHNPVIKGGVEYHITEPLYLRGGVGTNPTLSTYGFGYNYKKQLQFDFGGAFHTTLGFIPHFSLAYNLAK